MNVSDKFIIKIQTRPSGVIIQNHMHDLSSRRPRTIRKLTLNLFIWFFMLFTTMDD